MQAHSFSAMSPKFMIHSKIIGQPEASIPVELNGLGTANTVGDKIYVIGTYSNGTIILIYDPRKIIGRLNSQPYK